MDSFLLISGLAYFVCVLLPHKVSNMPGNRWIERITMGSMGALILSNLFLFNNFYLWAFLGIMYVPASLLSYFHYVKWFIRGEEDRTNNLTQTSMFVWDLLISLISFSKVMGGLVL